jgi:hypothetical protein
VKAGHPPGWTSLSSLAGGVHQKPGQLMDTVRHRRFSGAWIEPGAGAPLAEARRSMALNLKGEGCGSGELTPPQVRIGARRRFTSTVPQSPPVTG